MSLLSIFAIFIILIIVLSALRQKLVYETSGTSLLMFGSTKPGIVFYSLIFLPGTILHELSHWIVAEILQVRTGEITILPDFEGKGESQRLGSVATARSDPFRGFLIGVAPFISGLLSLIILGRLLEIGWGVYAFWQITLLIYGIMVIGNSMMISKEDRRTWPFIVVFLTLIAILIVKYYPDILTANNGFVSSALSRLNLVLGVTAGFNLVMIGGSYLTRSFVERVTKRRIIRK